VIPHSAYLHIPFCLHRCGYCDFNTYAGLERLMGPYLQALCQEIRLSGAQAQAWSGERLRLHTVFLGGGTPSLLPAPALEQILDSLRTSFSLLPGAEISLEANPGTLSLAFLQDLRQVGFNRLSLGMQSAQANELRLLERQHSFEDVIRSVGWARQAGFDNLNLDLIFALPEQELQTWQESLEWALRLKPEHLSLYALSIEHGTPFAHLAQRGLLAEPDPDRAADMYEWATERLGHAGYTQYEISNWAAWRTPAGQAGAELLSCRHNLQYWRGLPYLGFGAGAHGYAANTRTANVLAPAVYIQRMQQSGAAEKNPPGFPAPPAFPATPAAQTIQPVSRLDEIGETMMMGLRLTGEGVSARAFGERFGEALAQRFEAQIRRFTNLGLLEWASEDPDRLRLTRRGRLLGNQVFMEFLP
jgi:oxygen-independent coproporphyrinogen-3 oxidase